MTINSLTNSIPSYLESAITNAGNHSASASTSQALANLFPGISSSISPTASFLSQLQRLQERNPTEYSQVGSSIAAQTQSDGSGQRVSELGANGSAFDGAATAADGLGGHHHHHDGGATGTDADPWSTAAASTSSSSGSGDSTESMRATAFSNAMSSIGQQNSFV